MFSERYPPIPEEFMKFWRPNFMLGSPDMRSKLFGSAVGFTAAALGISVLYIGFVFAQTSTDTLTDVPAVIESIDAAAGDTAGGVASIPVDGVTAGQAKVKDKAELLDRLDVEKKIAREFAETGSSLITLIDDGFSGKPEALDEVSNEISEVKIYFLVSNPSARKNRLTLNTGIQKGTLVYIRVEGATGYQWEGEELVLAYISLPPKGSTIVTVTALPLISDRPLKISTSPILKGRDGTVIATGETKSRTISGKSINILKGLKMSGSKAGEMAVPVLQIPATPDTSPPAETASTSTTESVLQSTANEQSESVAPVVPERESGDRTGR